MSEGLCRYMHCVVLSVYVCVCVRPLFIGRKLMSGSVTVQIKSGFGRFCVRVSGRTWRVVWNIRFSWRLFTGVMNLFYHPLRVSGTYSYFVISLNREKYNLKLPKSRNLYEKNVTNYFQVDSQTRQCTRNGPMAYLKISIRVASHHNITSSSAWAGNS